jgi:hypothetical protein
MAEISGFYLWQPLSPVSLCELKVIRDFIRKFALRVLCPIRQNPKHRQHHLVVFGDWHACD